MIKNRKDCFGYNNLKPGKVALLHSLKTAEVYYVISDETVY